MTYPIVILVPAIAFILYAVLLYLVWREGFVRRVNRRFALYLFAMMVWSLGALMMYLDQSHINFWNKVMVIGTTLMPLAVFGFVVQFLGNREEERWLLLGALVYVVVYIPLIISGAVASNIDITEAHLVEYELEWGAIPLGAYYFFFVLWSARDLWRGLRRTRDYVAHNRIRYVFLGLMIIVLGSLTNLKKEWGAYPIDIAANAVNALLLSYTIFRYNLLDITFILRRGMLYAIPTMVIGIGYLLIILMSVTLFRVTTGYQLFVLSLVVAALVALVMQPVQNRLQTWVDALFFREKYDAGRMLERLSRTASSVLDLSKLASMILDDVAATIHIEKLALFLKREKTGVFELAAQRGLGENVSIVLRDNHPIVKWLARNKRALKQELVDMTPQFKAIWADERRDLETMEAELFVPLVTQEKLIGILVLGPKKAGTSYSPDEILLLSTLANQTAIAVQNAWLYQQALAEKERTEIILEHAFAGMIMVDEEMRVIVANPAAESITGRAARDLLGESILQVFPREMWDVGSPLYTVIETGESVGPVEVELAVDDAHRDLLVGVTRILDGYLINFTDITKLKEVARLQSNIVMNVSHELRTPLTSIKGYAELLMTQFLHDPETLERFLKVIQSEADRMNRIVNDLLDFSRLESGRYRAEKTYLDMNALVRESVQGLEVQARQAGVVLDVDIPDNLPLLLGDRDLLVSVVKNLVGNAIKFSMKGGRVRVALRQQDSALVLEVEDKGLGIPEEDIPHLFTKFYRSERVHKAGIKGTGLGLALVKQAVELHDGTIQVESKLGMGTRFSVVFPLQTEERADAPL
ncbi:MAG: GAF domain-containing protein [Chloroflexi bacterium]|nr:GAF domain-containing protein [Chloroflexota bacterium]